MSTVDSPSASSTRSIMSCLNRRIFSILKRRDTATSLVSDEDQTVKLPGEILLHIFNHVEDVPINNIVNNTAQPVLLSLRLTCKRWNELLANRKNLKLLNQLRMPIDVLRIAQVGTGYAIFMVNITNHGSRVIRFDKDGRATRTTQAVDQDLWGNWRAMADMSTVATITEEFLAELNHILQEFSPRFFFLGDIRLNCRLLDSLSAILERYPRIPRIRLEQGRVEYDEIDKLNSSMRRFLVNSVTLYRSFPYISGDLIHSILANSDRNDHSFAEEHSDPQIPYIEISLKDFEKVTYFDITFFKTSVKELFDAIERRAKVDGEADWEITLTCQYNQANRLISEEAMFRKFQELPSHSVDIHNFIFEGVKLTIKLRGKNGRPYVLFKILGSDR